MSLRGTITSDLDLLKSQYFPLPPPSLCLKLRRVAGPTHLGIEVGLQLIEEEGDVAGPLHRLGVDGGRRQPKYVRPVSHLQTSSNLAGRLTILGSTNHRAACGDVDVLRGVVVG